MRVVAASRNVVSAALVDPDAIARWRVSDDMRAAMTMTMTMTLCDAPGGTEVTVVHGGNPDVIPRADNELGTRMALDRLARLVEAR